jgi:hypothetical protein
MQGTYCGGWRRCACLDAGTRVLVARAPASTTCNNFIADLLFLSEVPRPFLLAWGPCVRPCLGKSALHLQHAACHCHYRRDLAQMDSRGCVVIQNRGACHVLNGEGYGLGLNKNYKPQATKQPAPPDLQSAVRSVPLWVAHRQASCLAALQPLRDVLQQVGTDCRHAV